MPNSWLRSSTLALTMTRVSVKQHLANYTAGYLCLRHRHGSGVEGVVEGSGYGRGIAGGTER
jgi:hypothetical protein